MSDKLKGFMLEEGAGLSAQSAQNLRTLTKGSLQYQDVAWALRQLDYSSGERLLPSRLGSRPVMAADAGHGND
eukprot:358206-Pyramimonas_sp.AAC.1